MRGGCTDQSSPFGAAWAELQSMFSSPKLTSTKWDPLIRQCSRLALPLKCKSLLRLEVKNSLRKLVPGEYKIGVFEDQCRADKLRAGSVESRPVTVAVAADEGRRWLVRRFSGRRKQTMIQGQPSPEQPNAVSRPVTLEHEAPPHSCERKVTSPAPPSLAGVNWTAGRRPAAGSRVFT